MKKRVSFALFLFLLVASIFPATASAAGTGFKDVPEGSFYEEPVAWAVEAGITGGTTATTFSPQSTCSNAQVITFLWRACGSPEPQAANPFDDVAEGRYYCDAALWAYENGMVDGGSFQPDRPCSRSMAMTYLWKEAGMPEPAGNPEFSDVSDGADYFDAVAWGVERGITGGTTETTFSPQNTCTRAQIITFLYRDLMGDPGDGSGSFEIII